MLRLLHRLGLHLLRLLHRLGLHLLLPLHAALHLLLMEGLNVLMQLRLLLRIQHGEDLLTQRVRPGLVPRASRRMLRGELVEQALNLLLLLRGEIDAGQPFGPTLVLRGSRSALALRLDGRLLDDLGANRNR